MVVNTFTRASLTDTEVDRIFQALADSTRRDIIGRVIQHEESVSALAERYAMSFAAVQKHVAVLERASLIIKQRSGRVQLVHGNPAALRRASQLLDEYEEIWKQRAKGIELILAEDRLPEAATPKERTE